MGIEWDAEKAQANFNKHGVRFAECIPVFEDDYAITITDDESDPGEQRFVSLGMGAKGRVLVVAYSYRRTRYSHHCRANRRAARVRAIRGKPMKQRYNFSKGRRGRIAEARPEPQGKTRITIRLDDELVDYFLKEADRSGGKTGYQTLINDALRQFIEGKAPKFEETLRRIVREEIQAAG